MPIAIDETIFLFLNGLTGRWFYFDFFAYFSAAVLPLFLLALLLYFLLRNYKKYKYLLIRVILSGAFAYATVLGLRFFLQRPRPFLVIREAHLLLPLKESFSLPSGHTAFLFAVSLVLFLHKKTAGTVFIIFSFLVGVSRIAVGMHWPSDIIAGTLVGVLFALLIFEIAEWRKNKE